MDWVVAPRAPDVRNLNEQAVAVAGAQRTPAIDGFRMIAASAVLLLHLHIGVAVGGDLGVDVFFVISGYVITSLLLRDIARTGRVPLARFYAQRLARLWPALLAMLGACLIYSLAVGGAYRAELRYLPGAALYASNFTMGLHAFALLYSHVWTLAIEEQFYIVWPVVLMFMLRRRMPVVPVLLAFIVIAPAWRWHLVNSPQAWWRINRLPDTRADQLLMGCVLAILIARHGARVMRRVSRVVGPLCFVGLIVLMCTPRSSLPGGDVTVLPFLLSATGLLSAGVVAHLASTTEGVLVRCLGSKVLAWPGRNLSYGIYLWQLPVLHVVHDSGMPQPWVSIDVVVITVGFAFLSWRFVESPGRQWVARKLAR